MRFTRRDAKAYARANFKGLWAAAQTPFLPDLTIDEAGLRRNLRHWVDDLGVDGVFVGGKQGEFFSMSVPERKRLFDIALDEIGGTRTIMSCSDQNMDVVLDLARHAKAIGSDYIVVHAPVLHFFKAQDETVYEYYRTIAEKVDSFRRLLLRRRAGPVPPEPLLEAARELGGLLLGPVGANVSRARSLLLVPDGPLHLLPFSALVRSPGRFLVEEEPLLVVSSATVLAELRRPRGDRPAGAAGAAVVVFGAPSYPKPDGPLPADGRVRAAVQRGSLSPLPATRVEVEEIRRSAKDVRAWVGAEATEERAKAIGRETRIVHFACHGILDERNPLDSALALSIPEKPGRENGLLQAWEVLESVRLDADLVTLSACGTALGVEEGGEGIVGLTRAFQWAGARSVVASLWNVSDDSTAELMGELYRRLASGARKDEALRLAQLSLLAKGGDAGHPFFWAAFELLGDSR
jgi:CHAT domain-containing protein